MNIERIINFCKRKLAKEAEADEIGSEHRAAAFQEVIDYYQKSKDVRKSDVEKIKEIFLRHYQEYHKKTTGRNLKYRFEKREENHIKKLIPHMKEHLTLEDTDELEMPVDEFFDGFLERMPDWWKDNCYSVSTISRHFNKILTQIQKNHSEYGKQQQRREKYRTDKPTVKDILTTIASSNPEG